ncbi:MAG: succinylglutamate desuccinylase/aspartoacylase family protein [Gammaproteobacteria bacterium]|nr:succinylglutamate desuccinylase/aspartoacylase family protein [Gammaproteobacteria bacterium]
MGRLIVLFLLVVSLPLFADADKLEFTLHKKESGKPGKTILVIGGIQGDEPGGFNAASLLVTHYQVNKGNIWVVPNLNFQSIIHRSRGMNGDMNRKFANVPSSDPDYDTVQRIKQLIKSEQVDYIFNLHDGSGFYRETYIDKMHSPMRWGQSIIIDQEELDDHDLGNMNEAARTIVDRVNERLLDQEHVYRVKNTRTREGDHEMEKTLTYFAINHGKPAIGIEASKSLPTHQRAYYHLQVLEAYMDWLGLEYQRDMNLQAAAVKDAIDNNVKVSFYQNRIFMDMKNARKTLRYVPLREGSHVEFSASSPLVAITSRKNGYRINYGNRRVTDLHPQYFDYDNSLSSITMLVDGEEKQVTPGSIVDVDQAFRVETLEGYRVNVIGWSKKKLKNESGHDIYRNEIVKRYSIDKQGTIFRVELYKDKKFSGMVLVRFPRGSETAKYREAEPFVQQSG